MTRIGFLSNHNPFDRNTFSSTAYFMYQSLAAHPECSVRVIGNHRRSSSLLGRLRKSDRGAGALSAADFRDLNLVLCLVSSGLVPEAARLTSAPVVHLTDGTPGFLREFYKYDVPTEGTERERAAIEAADMVLYSSHFMQEYALQEFGEEFRAKMAAIPWGANLDDLPTSAPVKGPLDPLRLLFMGSDWTRKGGDIAVATLQELRARGVNAEMTLIGAGTEESRGREAVTALGYLDKNNTTERARLQRALQEAHFFLLPTRADCTPMVVAEANSYAIPVLITETGGIGSLMAPGRNGDMLPLGATATDYADRLMELSRDAVQYRALSQSSYDHFRERLNWTAWANNAMLLFKDRLLTGQPQ